MGFLRSVFYQTTVKVNAVNLKFLLREKNVLQMHVMFFDMVINDQTGTFRSVYFLKPRTFYACKLCLYPDWSEYE